MASTTNSTLNSMSLPCRKSLGVRCRIPPQLRAVATRKHQARSFDARMAATRAQETATEETTPSTSRLVTIEKQRVIAKDLVKYFEDKQYEELYQKSRTFGWTYEAELANGRWVMFGLMVGLMTEYATGVNFVDQIRITITNLGFADIYD